MGKIEAGVRADITIFDTSDEFTVAASAFESKSRNSPFNGWRLKGRAIHVLVAGRLRLHSGQLVE
jgi:dihydroorotase